MKQLQQTNKIRVIWAIFLLAMTVLLALEFIRIPTGIFDYDVKNENDWTKAGFKIMGTFGFNFSFFTYWTNIAIIIILFMDVVAGWRVSSCKQNIIITYATTTMIIYFILIAPFRDGWGKNSWDDFTSIYFHLITIMIVYFWFFLFAKKQNTPHFKKQLLHMWLIPGIYLAFATVLYFVSKYKFPVYPFIDFRDVLGLDLPLGMSIFLASILCVFVVCFFTTTSYVVHKIQVANNN